MPGMMDNFKTKCNKYYLYTKKRNLSEQLSECQVLMNDHYKQVI
jgi:hypothetical protein